MHAQSPNTTDAGDSGHCREMVKYDPGNVANDSEQSMDVIKYDPERTSASIRIRPPNPTSFII